MLTVVGDQCPGTSFAVGGKFRRRNPDRSILQEIVRSGFAAERRTESGTSLFAVERGLRVLYEMIRNTRLPTISYDTNYFIGNCRCRNQMCANGCRTYNSESYFCYELLEVVGSLLYVSGKDRKLFIPIHGIVSWDN